MGTGFHFEEGMPLFTIEGADIPVILALMAAAIGVEIFLALKKDGRLGLILPGLGLLRSAARLITRVILLSGYSALPDMGGALFLAVAAENVPTLILLAVYGLCRWGRGWRTRRQLEKTRIDDL